MNGQKTAEEMALYVAHFIRRNARIAALLANFTNVYIKQVLPTVDKDVIDAFFAKFGGITSSIAKKDSKGRVFAFCNFASHDEAVKCIEAIHGTPVDGLTGPEDKIYVQRAQPRSERLVELRQKYMQRQSLGNNLYVRNFDQEFSDENLRELFAEYGDIKSCKVMRDEKGNLSVLSLIELSGGILTGWVLAFCPAMWATCSVMVNQVDPHIIKMVHTFTWIIFDCTYMITTMQMVAMGLFTVLNKRQTMFPAWAGWTAIAVGVSFIALVFMPFVTEGPFTVPGLWNFWVIFSTWIWAYFGVYNYYVLKHVYKAPEAQARAAGRLLPA